MMSACRSLLITCLALMVSACGAAATASPAGAPTASPVASVRPSPHTPSPTAPETAAPTPGEDLSALAGLTFVREADGLRQIFAVESDGSLRELELPVMEHLTGPVRTLWSPDARHLAFVLGSITDFVAIGIIDADGGEPLIVNGAAYPAWSPDGSRLVATNTFHVMPPEGFNHLVVTLIDPDSGETTDVGRGASPAWHPDGRRLVVYRNRGASGEFGGTPQLVLIDVTDGSEAELTLGASQATWSPDGSRVAYVVTPPNTGRTEIWLADGESNPRPLVGGPFSEQPHWSPDGTLLAYTFSAPDATHVGVIEIETEAVTDLGAGHTPIAWSPDGRRIAVAAIADQAPIIRVIDLDAGELARIPGEGASWRPAP